MRELLDSDGGAAAVQAAKRAAAKLPPVDEIDFSVAESGAPMFRGDRAARNHGCKTAPRGHPDCLSEFTFVLSGVYESLHRHEAEDLIKRHGGRITSAVSGKTTFLVVGEDTGQSKFEEARKRGTKLIDEDGLFSLIKASEHLVKKPTAQPQKPPQHQLKTLSGAAGPSTVVLGSRPVKQGPGNSRPGPSRQGTGELWVDKYKPQKLSDIVANTVLVNTLKGFLQQWEDIHIRGRDPRPVDKGGQRRHDLTKKAVLLSGPPGIGKTTSATIVAKECGFRVVEVNASDTRNQSDKSVLKGVGSKVSNMVKELSTNTAMHGEKVCIVMDEVDGMSAGDRGGIADLIKVIQGSRVPIVCICNDKYSQKLRSLKNHTLMLDYRRPTKQQVTKRLLEICNKEGLRTNNAALEALTEMSQGDIRMVIGQLQMIRLRTDTFTYDDAKGTLGLAKDATISPFVAADSLLGLPSDPPLSLKQREELMFQDLDLVPLLIQENYLNHRPMIAVTDRQRLLCIAKAAEALSAGDIVNQSIRRRGNWNLMPFSAYMGGVYPCAYMRGPRELLGINMGEQNFPRFTAWLGNNSSFGKQKRLLGELHTRMTASSNFVGDRKALRMDILPYLRRELFRPLAEKGQEGVDEMVGRMHDYCLVRDDFEFVTDITKFKTKAAWGEDPLKGVDSKVKAAFTRRFNKDSFRPPVSTMVEEAKGGRGKKRKAEAMEAPLTEDADAVAEAAVFNEEEEEGEDEEMAVDPQQLSVNFEPAAKKVKGAKGAAQKSGATKGAKGGAKGAGAKGGGTKGPAKPKSGGKGGATRQLTLV